MERQIKTCFKRYEKKFFLTEEQYRLFKEKAAPFIRADEYGKYTICNIYYDTDNYSLIRASLEKPVYKEKLRVRSYGVTGPDDRVFVELKKKFEGVVYKRRVTMTQSSSEEFLREIDTVRSSDQIKREIEYFMCFHRAAPKVFLAYDREAFQGADDPELRITFDTGIRWRMDRLSLSEGDDGQPLLDNGMILLEIKIPGACPLWLTGILSALKINSVSFSKYGTCYKNHLMANNKDIKKEMRLSA